MMRILICMMAAVALAILVVSGCGEAKERCHETGNQVTTFVMVGNVLLPITSNEITCEQDVKMADFMHQMIAVFKGSDDQEVKECFTVDKPYSASLTSFGISHCLMITATPGYSTKTLIASKLKNSTFC